MDKVIFSDENDIDKALTGIIIKEDSDFIHLKQDTRLVKISKHRIIKIETDIKNE